MKQQQEAALLAAFRLMDAEEREFQLEVFKLSTEGRHSVQKPILRLIQTQPQKH